MLTRTLIPLMALVALQLSGCNPFQGEDHPTDRLRWPVGVEADPGGRYLYVLNTNFDLAFLGGNVVVIDTRSNRIVENASVQTGSFGGQIRAMAGADGATQLYLTTREGNALTWVTVQGTDSDSPTLKCRAEALSPGTIQVCAGAERLIDDSAELSPGSDPFGLAVDPATDRIYLTSFSGNASVLSVGDDGAPTIQGQSKVDSGLYGVAVHPITGVAYATSKTGNAIRALGVTPLAEGDPGTEQGQTVAVSVSTALTFANATVGRDFGRGIAFNAAGTRVFVAYRTPPSLLVVDMSVDEAGNTANQILDDIPLPNGPASVVVAPTGPAGEERVYVTLYDADEVAVIDPQRHEAVATIDMGDGPFDLAIVGTRAYVTLFEDNAVGVIELDPTSPFYHQEIARIR